MNRNSKFSPTMGADRGVCRGDMGTRCISSRLGGISAAVLVIAVAAQPAWALDLTETDAIGPSLSQFSVTPPEVPGVAGTIGETQDLPLPASNLLFFTPRVMNFDAERESEAGTCNFISPEVDGASCYKHPVGDGANLALGTVQGSGLVTGSAMDQALAQGLTGLSGELHTDLEAGSGFEKAFAVGVEYQKRVQNLDLGLSTSLRSNPKDVDNTGQIHPEVQSWMLGLSAGYTGFTFSTSYFEDRVKAEGDRDSYTNLDSQETFDLGVKYDLGPWAFGVQYSHSQMDALQIGADLGDQGVDSYEIGGSYLMGQRLSLGAAIQFWKWDEFAGSTAEDEQKEDLLFLIGSRLKF